MIRFATVKDIPVIMELSCDFYHEGLSKYLTLDKDSLLRTVWSLMTKGVFLVAEEDKEVVGVIAGVIDSSNFNVREIIAQEIIWYVKDAKRKGTPGIRLFDAFSETCEKLGASRIVMAHMQLNAKTMSKLYKRKGYKEMETRYIKEVL